MSPRRWIDVSVPLRDGLVPWPGDPPFRLERVFDLARGDVCNCSSLSTSAHIGTHIDAPLHFLRDGRPIDTLPVEATVGPARVVQIRNPLGIEHDDLGPLRIRTGERLLFKTSNSARGQPGDFFEDYVAVSPEAARYLASRRLRAVGIDGPSIGRQNGGTASCLRRASGLSKDLPFDAARQVAVISSACHSVSSAATVHRRARSFGPDADNERNRPESRGTQDQRPAGAAATSSPELVGSAC